MNWKTLVEKQNAATYVLPEGWESRDEVAEQLECSPERVSEILRPAVKSGAVEVQVFRVWNAEQKRVVMVTAYRQRTKGDATQPVGHKPGKWTPELVAQAKKRKAAGDPYSVIGAALGFSGTAVRMKLRAA